jgi:enterobacterial common antigen flippase
MSVVSEQPPRTPKRTRAAANRQAEASSATAALTGLALEDEDSPRLTETATETSSAGLLVATEVLAADPDGSAFAANRTDPIVKSSVTYWIAAAIALAFGLLRTKVTAIAVGPHGLGIVSQLNNVALVLGAVSVLGVPVFGARALARARAQQDREAERSVIRFILTAPLLCAVALVLFALLFRQQLSAAVVGSSAYGLGLLMALLSVPFNIAFTALQTLQQGRDNASRFNRTVVVAAIGNLIVVIPLVVLWGFRGAELAMLATSVVLFAVAARSAPGDLRQISLRGLRLGPTERTLLRAGIASVILGTLVLGVETALRSRLGHLHGFRAVGLYQPASLLSTQMFLQFDLGITLFLTTKLSASLALDDDHAVRSSISSALRLGLLVGTPLMLLCVGGRSVIVATLFTGSFHGGQQAIALQMGGEFLRMISFVLGTALISAGRVRAWFAVNLLPLLLQLAVGWTLLPHMGIDALPVSFILAYGLTTVTVMLVLARLPVLRPSAREVRMTSACAAVLAIAIAGVVISPTVWLDACVCAIAVAIPALCSTPAERRIFREKLAQATRVSGLRPRRV